MFSLGRFPGVERETSRPKRCNRLLSQLSQLFCTLSLIALLPISLLASQMNHSRPNPAKVKPADTSEIPEFGVSPSTVTFPVQAVGTASSPALILVWSAEGQPVGVTSFNASGDFSVSNTCQTDPRGPWACYFYVTFQPTATGARTGELTVNGSPAVALSGTGWPAGGGATTSALTSSGNAGGYSLTETVTGVLGKGLPTGSISFVDISNGDLSLGTGALRSPLINLSLANGPSFITGVEAADVATGDFNGDGKPDIAVMTWDTAGQNPNPSVSIYLGKGDGAFTAGFTPTSSSFSNIVSADFTGDGRSDIAYVTGTVVGTGANAYETNDLVVLFGNTDGSFTTQTISLPNSSTYDLLVLAIGDLNGDGKPDVAVNLGGNITVLLNQSNGTFKSIPVSGTASARGMKIADVNGDQKADLVINDGSDFGVTVFLGNGNGTFQPPITTNLQNATFFSNGDSIEQFATGDFNGDGKADVVIEGWQSTCEASNTKCQETATQSDAFLIFTSNGDGTFTVGSPIVISKNSASNSGSVAVADFNGDGKDDVAVLTNNVVQVFLGNGDSTFTASASIDSGAESDPDWLALAVADFNGDGIPDFAAMNSDAGTVTIAEGQRTETATATLASVAVPGAGTHNVEAVYLGDSNFATSTSASVALTGSSISTTLSLTSSAGTSTPGNQLVLTATLSPYSEGDLTTTGEKVTFSNNGATIGTGTLSLGVATLNTSSLSAGTNSVTASFAGDGSFTAANSQPASITITNPANPTPAMSSISPAYTSAGAAAFTLSVNGTGFIPNSRVYWGATALATTYVSATQLTTKVPASDIASTGSTSITILTPTPGGGTSNSLAFEVDSTQSTSNAPSFSNTTAAISPGSTATYSVTLPSSTTSATVQCLNLPVGASCTYSASTGAVSIATVATTPRGTYQITTVFTETVSGQSAAYVLLPFLLIPLCRTRKRISRKAVITLSWIVILAGAATFSMSGCGGGPSTTTPSTPPGQQVTSSGVVTLTLQ